MDQENNVFTSEMYEDYKNLKNIFADFYPVVMNSDYPLPLSPEALKLMSSDPYVRASDESIENFFAIWTARREYSIAICNHQCWFSSDGLSKTEMEPEVICKRARHLARMSNLLDLSKSKKKPRSKWRNHK